MLVACVECIQTEDTILNVAPCFVALSLVFQKKDPVFKKFCIDHAARYCSDWSPSLRVCANTWHDDRQTQSLTDRQTVHYSIVRHVTLVAEVEF